MSNVNPLHVVALAYEGLCMFEFGIASEVFGLARPDLRRPWYSFCVCAAQPGVLRGNGGVSINIDAGLRALRGAGTIVIPGWRDVNETPPPEMLAALRLVHARGARIVSICTGAFALAAAGLLDGKRATTHWMHAPTLATRYPKLRVEPDVLFIDEGDILTSAGSSAGIDVCLHVVRKDFGAAVANQLARRLVAPPQRDGGQAQYVLPGVAQPAASALGPVMEWAQRRLSDVLRVEQLAERAAMSPRHFARRFKQEVGTTPHLWLTQQRVIAAQQRLETGDESIDQIAQAVGLQTAATLRHHFARILRVSPGSYRRRFARKVG